MTNIALIVLDTLRKDAFDEHFDWLPGTRFENAWSTSHWTVPAHASLFTGKYASEVGVYSNAETFDFEGLVLAERLRDAGYTTRAFSANPNISKQFAFDRGFEYFEGSWRLKSLEHNTFDWDRFIVDSRDMGPERYLLALWRCIAGSYDTIPSLKRGLLLKLRDLGLGTETIDDGATSALEMLQSTTFSDHEFLFLNLMEAHTPYCAPEAYQTVEPPELNGLNATLSGGPDDDPAQIRQAYDDEVHYLSDMYKQIFELLQDEFDLILTLSDHGELLGEHDVWEHMYGIYPELTHVPLSVFSGDTGRPTCQRTVSLLDVHATILDAAGLDASGRGRCLLDDLEDGEFLTEYHGISDRHYRSLQNDGFEDIMFLRSELNGLISGDYYGYETFDGFDEDGTSGYDDPQAHLAELVANIEKRTVAEEETVDDAVLKQLEDLGYA